SAPTFDPAHKSSRLKHTTARTSYQPLRTQNDGAAWRHRLAQPLQSPRETMLRPLGHETEPFDDHILAQNCYVRGISYDELR
ncbi:hypothetical protein QN369_25920, partial [Pseudomonas sp. CCI1.4]|nr:hypothetical protein [Pseudomonas sp. CCI1.4]